MYRVIENLNLESPLSNLLFQIKMGYLEVVVLSIGTSLVIVSKAGRLESEEGKGVKGLEEDLIGVTGWWRSLPITRGTRRRPSETRQGARRKKGFKEKEKEIDFSSPGTEIEKWQRGEGRSVLVGREQGAEAGFDAGRQGGRRDSRRRKTRLLFIAEHED
ncbi:hypothetical protein ACLOJK_032286 [Asimina triloba]